jgi:serine/threonine protein kinase
MGFDWELLKPGRRVTDAQKSVVEEIGLTFLNNGTGTPIHKKKVDLRNQRTLLNELEQFGLIRNHWNHYYPTFPALYFLPHPIRDAYAGYLHYIFQAIKVLFENRGPARLQIDEVERQTWVVSAGSEFLGLAQNGLGAIYFNRATSFLRDFPQSVMAEDSQKPEAPVGAVVPMEDIIDDVDLQQAWELELSRRRPVYMDASSATLNAKEATPAGTALGSDGGGMAGSRDNWETIGKPLGAGGQSTVYLVRRPTRLKARTEDIEQIFSFSPWGTSMAKTRAELTEKFADAVMDLGRADSPTELGALKQFELRNDEQQAISRLTQEVEILGEGRPGLPKLLDSNLNERWMVTEYFPHRTLEGDNSKYAGDVRRALKAFLSLAKTVAALHEQKIVHRDIKPANVFVREDNELILGDFGIVFLPDRPARLTRTNETVGPHDYMPPWAEVGGRLNEVTPKVDIYMLGKLLWCMVSGRLRLQREWFDRADYNPTTIFPGDPAMHMVNVILKRCVVENPAECETSASDLVAIVSTYVRMLDRGGQLLHVDIPRPCRVCGHGHYQDHGYAATQPPIPKGAPVGLRLWVGASEVASLPVYPYVCDSCGHVEFFTRGATRLGAGGSVDY